MTTTEKPQVFIDIKVDELSSRVDDYHERGWRFVNICGSTVEGGVELVYSFSDGLPMDNLRFVVANGTEIASVSALYPNAFFFENETHDLFGIKFSGVSIDFDGQFYKVSVPTPMNPASEQAKKAAADGEVAHAVVPASGTGSADAAAAAAADNTADNAAAADNEAAAATDAAALTPTTTEGEE